MARKKANQSFSKYKISAIALDKNGSVLATAVNRPRFSRKGGGDHAEMIALRKGGPRISSIMICRVGKSGNLLGIDPCKNCQKILDKLGIRVYSVNPK
jgi:hypothetical protein